MSRRAFSIVCGLLYAAAFSAAAQLPSPLPEQKNGGGGKPFKKCWEFPFDGVIREQIVSANGLVFISENGGKIRAVVSDNGRAAWTTELGGEIVAMRAVNGGIAVISRRQNGDSEKGESSLRLLNGETGLVRYTVPVTTSGSVFLETAGSRLLVVDTAGTLSSHDAASGTQVWTHSIPAQVVARPSANGIEIAIPTGDKKVHIFSIGSGKPTGLIELQRTATVVVLRENKMVIVGDDRGIVTTYRDYSGSVWWSFKSGARVGTITDTVFGVLIGSYDNFLYLVSNYSGDVKWKRRLEGRLVNDPFVANGTVFASVASENTAVSLDLENGKLIDQVFLGDENFVLSGPVMLPGARLVFALPGTVVAYSNTACNGK